MFSLWKSRAVALVAVILVAALLITGCSNGDDSHGDEAFNLGLQSANTREEIGEMHSELRGLTRCLRDTGDCGWPTAQREAVRQNMLSAHGANFPHEINSLRERVWDLWQEVAYAQNAFFNSRHDNSSDQARFAQLKSQGSRLISLPHEEILDQVETVVNQVRELGVGDAELGLITRALEGARFEIAELIRQLDS